MKSPPDSPFSSDEGKVYSDSDVETEAVEENVVEDEKAARQNSHTTKNAKHQVEHTGEHTVKCPKVDTTYSH